jgi:hypothetical protein
MMTTPKSIYVRIAPKNGPLQFLRCGISFTRAWKRLDDIDLATRQRLDAEQMLEVVTEQPDDYNVDEAAALQQAQADAAQADYVVKLHEQAQAAAIDAGVARKEAEDQLAEAKAVADAAAQTKADAQALHEQAEADAQVAAELRQKAESLREQASADTLAAGDPPAPDAPQGEGSAAVPTDDKPNTGKAAKGR